MIKCAICGKDIEYLESVNWNESDICPECFDQHDADFLDANTEKKEG